MYIASNDNINFSFLILRKEFNQNLYHQRSKSHQIAHQSVSQHAVDRRHESRLISTNQSIRFFCYHFRIRITICSSIKFVLSRCDDAFNRTREVICASKILIHHFFLFFFFFHLVIHFLFDLICFFCFVERFLRD
jgi:hypothetical protein